MGACSYVQGSRSLQVLVMGQMIHEQKVHGLTLCLCSLELLLLLICICICRDFYHCPPYKKGRNFCWNMILDLSKVDT